MHIKLMISAAAIALTAALGAASADDEVTTLTAAHTPIATLHGVPATPLDVVEAAGVRAGFQIKLVPVADGALAAHGYGLILTNTKPAIGDVQIIFLSADGTRDVIRILTPR